MVALPWQRPNATEAYAAEQLGATQAAQARSLLQLFRPELMHALAAEADPEHALWTYLLRDGVREDPYLPHDKALQSDLLQFLNDADCADLMDQLPLQPASPFSGTAFLEPLRRETDRLRPGAARHR